MKIKQPEDYLDTQDLEDFGLKPTCENCGEELTHQEILYCSGWCESCNLPERSPIK